MRNFAQASPQIDERYLPEFTGNQYSFYGLLNRYASYTPRPIGVPQGTMMLQTQEIYTSSWHRIDLPLPDSGDELQYWCVDFNLNDGTGPTLKNLRTGMCSSVWGPGSNGSFVNPYYPDYNSEPAPDGTEDWTPPPADPQAPPPAGPIHFIAEGGPNLFEVPVTALPYTDGCSGGAYAFNTCARNRLQTATGLSCTVYRVENSWAFPGKYQSRITCQ